MYCEVLRCGQAEPGGCMQGTEMVMVLNVLAGGLTCLCIYAGYVAAYDGHRAGRANVHQSAAAKPLRRAQGWIAL